ncbi:RGM domain family member B [Sciurus carolinensis]|uniref:RGM domain family member B n=1 Tax=Sciurus carolinensis TaxID=30640 RepID=A0AA41MDR1_SCICA|nr:RGM domain family member B [Sciurus carolinensis]
MVPAPPPSLEPTRHAWTGTGFRAAPACATTATALASAAATRAEQRRCPRPCPQPLALLLLLLLNLGQLHAVQVMNVPVVPGSSSTAMNKITIIFKAHPECADQKVYQAVTDDLPAAFVDGTTSGRDGEVKSLHMVESESGRYMEMHAGYIGTKVFV